MSCALTLARAERYNPTVSLAGLQVRFKPQLRPIRIVLSWQVVVTAALSLLAAFLWGKDGALSAALGGGVNVVAGWVYGWRVAQAGDRTAGEALGTLFRAWGIKILLLVVQLVLVMKMYQELVPAAFFLAFVATVGVFSAAIAVSDAPGNKTPRPAGKQ
jgi:ATP synthase protein I